MSDNVKRFLVTFFLGWIGAIIVNNTSLKPEGWRCRVLFYFIPVLNIISIICNFMFDPAKESNFGYKKA